MFPPPVDLPVELQVDFVEKMSDGETNDVYRGTARIEGRRIGVFIKIGKPLGTSLRNEAAVLQELQRINILAPRVVWSGTMGNDVLIVEAIPGELLWDIIDPRRAPYQGPDLALSSLRQFGECLSRIHNLPLSWPPQPRTRLYGLIGEEFVEDEPFRRLVAWLQSRPVPQTEPVFVHGDYHTASVLFENGAATGVIDWEFSGRGWREYELAWALRARTSFLNTPAERTAILDGYRRQSAYSEKALRWCEVLNYLHFAYWTREKEPAYSQFAVNRGFEIAEI